MGLKGARSRKRAGGDRENGAALVEFAMLLPFLLILILGIVEFGFLLGRFNEVRHGTHEGARLAAVDDANLGDNTCNSMNLPGFVEIKFTDGATGAIGEQASVTVTYQVSSLSGLGFMEAFLPSELSNTAQFKLEQPSDNWDTGTQDRLFPPGIPTCP